MGRITPRTCLHRLGIVQSNRQTNCLTRNQALTAFSYGALAFNGLKGSCPQQLGGRLYNPLFIPILPYLQYIFPFGLRISFTRPAQKWPTILELLRSSSKQVWTRGKINKVRLPLKYWPGSTGVANTYRGFHS